MKTLKNVARIGLLAAIPLLALGCAGMSTTNVDAFREAVEESFADYCASLLEGNADLFLSIHAEDVVKMGPGAPSAVGIEALEQRIRGGLETVSYEEFDVVLEEVQAAGDLGFARGTYTFRATVLANGQVMEYDGKYLTVFKKQPDGSWKIYRDCFNSNTP